MMKKTCARCEQEFEPKSNNSKYCSFACRVGVRACETCGTMFAPKNLQCVGRFCSRGCSARSLHTRLAIKICPQCQQSFRPGMAVQKFCGRVCANAGQRTERQYTDCAHCGKPLHYKRAARVRFCSRTCFWNSGDVRADISLPIGTLRPYRGGYMWIKVPRGTPGANPNWLPQHRHVMQQVLGRPLQHHEHVNHRNGQKHDNRPENLELWSTPRQPKGQRVSDMPHCPTCTCAVVPG